MKDMIIHLQWFMKDGFYYILAINIASYTTIFMVFTNENLIIE